MRQNDNQRERRTRINGQISISPVRVTMAGQSLGVMSLQEATSLAQQHGLDLVEIAPHLRPPVCEILDYAKFRFEQGKRKKVLRPRQPQPKEVRLRPVSSDHDVDVRAGQVKRFLTEKRNVTVIVEFRGRQNALADARKQADRVVERILTAVADLGKLDCPVKMDGKRLIARISPK
jgi:translation initiation factor IF-3